jgi:phosphopantothenoylcysteine decarboxylase/phosphopantothenate--cysteine ligase
MTKRACEFVQPLTFKALSGSHVIVDDYAPDNPDPIAHITFSQTVDLFLIAPATANLIAKFANGIADDFLSSTYLACTAPVLLAPAMNSTMWRQPATQRNLRRLQEDGVSILEPDEGEMACGTVGPGRLSDPERIVSAVMELLDQRGHSQLPDLRAEHIVITAGATREEIDPVRFISNRSSGRMGFAIAEAAKSRGAQVTLIAGVTTVTPPREIKLVKVSTAAEMHAAVMAEISQATVFIAAAAVADYKPVTRAKSKTKKSEVTLSLVLERTKDILQDVAALQREELLVVGFAAETDNIIANAREKLIRKKVDAIIANDVSRSDSGFDSQNNAISILRRGQSHPLELPLMTKAEAANQILNEVAAMRIAKSSLSKGQLSETALAGDNTR